MDRLFLPHHEADVLQLLAFTSALRTLLQLPFLERRRRPHDYLLLHLLGQKDSTEASLAQFLDDLVFIKIVVIILAIERVLLAEAEAGPAEGGRLRLEEGLAHGAVVGRVDG